MSKLTKLQLVCAALMALCVSMAAHAFNPSVYATTSRLATGNWVKITIPEDGVYEITYEELRAMGFNNPAKVKIYGNGGNRINEVLNGRAPDDLKAVPMLREGNKICFYGRGPIAYSLSDGATAPHFTRVFNPYSQVGCYFLVEDNTGDVHPIHMTPISVDNYVDKPTSLNFYHHEKELVSFTNSGKEMLGEDFTSGNLKVDYYLPGLADSTVVVYTTLAANASAMCYANGVLHSGGAADSTNFSQGLSRIYTPGSSYVMYNFASPYGRVKLTHPAEHGQFEPILKNNVSDFSATIARLDLFIITYTQQNILDDDSDGQMVMGYGLTRGNERFMLPNASDNIVVWNIMNTSTPLDMPLEEYNDESGQGVYFFATSATTSMYVAFDPTKTLKKISGFEPVENQNLHGMAVPDMLIITDKSMMDQAQRIADLHAAVDGIDVAVVNQEQVFNEFSSGTRDAMGYRLLCKMLYDRNSTKFKNLLLLGTGSFDNRELLGKHEGQLLTYQSDNSNYEDFSYTCDDFFGFLRDNSGASIPSEALCIGVGRMTSINAEEARSDVDKLAEYLSNPDYGVWRNRTMVFSDAPDRGLYMFQGEGYKNQIDNELGTGMHVTTVHNTMYPRSNSEPNLVVGRKTATEAKQLLSNTLKDGVYFATYVGHAGPLTFTRTNSMWTVGDVVTTNYPHLPIMSTACCDVAHYDGEARGIAELMFHKRDGGAIALMTSSRMVYATDNDMLNRFFLNAMFSNATTGTMPTLGEAYMQAKLGFNSSNTNKLSFLLLGDPAIRINYPVSRFNITWVNNTNVTNPSAKANISPLMKFQVKAQVVDEEGNVDTSFNGDATVTLYDKQDLFTTLTFTVSGQGVDRDIYFNREKLAEVTGRVVNGQFTGYVIVPRKVQAKNADVLLRVYAHKDNSSVMVNGFTKQITMLAYNESQAITDNQSPVITNMYINDETSFADGATVGNSSVLYINASDDQGINVQSNSGDAGMMLVLDGGKPSYSDISSYATLSDEGKQLHIEFPLNNLSEGLHTLTYTVFDMLGNSATRTISFMVGQSGMVNLTADKLPAFVGEDVNFGLETTLARMPEVIVRVTDATGNLVWMTTTSSFPVNWDLKDMNGNKVPAGLYRYFGTYNNGGNYGGTPINKLIVLDPVKRAAN